VPNDIFIGGQRPGGDSGRSSSSGGGGGGGVCLPRFLVLTGPNMGGKSTLLRQVCLATILAQVMEGRGGTL
jgi:hypothetical protein